MSELRKDPVVGRWVIIASDRGKRPSDFPLSPAVQRGGFCPFCEGNEDKTPPEILAYRPGGNGANRPGWKVRVVPNKFPALQVEGDLRRQGEGLFDKMNGIGAHEVIIEGPRHDVAIHELDLEAVRDVLWACRERAQDLKRDARLRYIQIFKNFGYEAGATLEHGHIQLIATPIVPKRVMEELQGSETYYRFKERCVFCDIIAQETGLGRGVRVVAQSEAFLALSPWAARFPFETWILPARHRSAFEAASGEEMLELASILRDVLGRLEVALGNPSYNLVVHTSPCQGGELSHYHWHVEILPKLTRVAGFEWGSGFFINPTSPELAAEALREVRRPVDARPGRSQP